MNIVDKKLENSSVEFEIEIPADKVESEYKEVFSKIQKSVKLDGFRKGKAPVQMIEARYSDVADKEVAENLAKHALVDAITERQLYPINEPRYDFKPPVRGEPFSFKAVIEVPPTVELGKYFEVAAEEKSFNITDEDVQGEIDALRERQADVQPKDEEATVENGDLTRIKIRRIDDADDKDSVDFKEYTIIVGKSTDDSALDKKITGMKKGEMREVQVKYPKDYYLDELAGQKVTYEVEIAELSSMALPEFDDEFAKGAGYESKDDMLVKTREFLENFFSEKVRGEAKSQIIRTIVENSTFDIPRTMIDKEMMSQFRKKQERLGFQAESVEQFASALGVTVEEFTTVLEEDALQSIKTTLALSEIIKTENLEVDDEKYREVIERYAQSYGRTVEDVEREIEANNNRDNIEFELLLDQAMDLLYEKAKIKKLKPVSIKELASAR